MYTRTRTKGVPVSTAFGHVRTLSGTGVISSVTVGTNRMLSIGESLVTTDQVIPDFKSRSAAGELFFNPFNRVRERFSVLNEGFILGKRVTATYPGEVTPWQNVSFSRMLGFTGNMGALQGTHDPTKVYSPHVTSILGRNASAGDVAINAALSNIVKTDALLLVTLGELRETLALIGKYSQLITMRLAPFRDFVYNLHKKRYTAGELAEKASNQWLEYRYGIMPLVYEIEGVAKALSRKVESHRLTARGSKAWEDGMLSTSIFSQGVAYYPVQSFSVSTRITANVSAGFLYVPLIGGTAASLGLHVSHIPESLFELAKLSFVANWFMDLSEFIRALTATVRGDVKGGWLTERYEIITTCSVSCQSFPAGTVDVNGVAKPVQWSVTSQEGATTVATRSVVVRTPVGAALPRAPSLRLQLSPARVADAVALTAQSFLDIQPTRRTLRL